MFLGLFFFYFNSTRLECRGITRATSHLTSKSEQTNKQTLIAKTRKKLGKHHEKIINKSKERERKKKMRKQRKWKKKRWTNVPDHPARVRKSMSRNKPTITHARAHWLHHRAHITYSYLPHSHTHVHTPYCGRPACNTLFTVMRGLLCWHSFHPQVLSHVSCLQWTVGEFTRWCQGSKPPPGLHPRLTSFKQCKKSYCVVFVCVLMPSFYVFHEMLIIAV